MIINFKDEQVYVFFYGRIDGQTVSISKPGAEPFFWMVKKGEVIWENFGLLWNMQDDSCCYRYHCGTPAAFYPDFERHYGEQLPDNLLYDSLNERKQLFKYSTKIAGERGLL